MKDDASTIQGTEVADTVQRRKEEQGPIATGLGGIVAEEGGQLGVELGTDATSKILSRAERIHKKQVQRDAGKRKPKKGDQRRGRKAAGVEKREERLSWKDVTRKRISTEVTVRKNWKITRVTQAGGSLERVKNQKSQMEPLCQQSRS